MPQGSKRTGSKWLTTAEATVAFGIHERTLRRHATRGLLVKKYDDRGRALYRATTESSNVLLVPLTEAERRKVAFRQGGEEMAKAFIRNITKQRELIPTQPTDRLLPIQSAKSSLVLLLSDLHIGKETPHFNIEIAKQAIFSIPDKVADLNLPECDEIVVILAGDIIDGEGIYPTHPNHVEIPVISQTKLAAEWIWHMLVNLQRVTNMKIRVETVYGNHGRAGKFVHEKTNWDNVLYYMLDLAASLNDYPDIAIYPNLDEFRTFPVKDKIGLVTHIGPKHGGTPAMKIKIAGWQRTKKYDFLCYGHYHEWEVYQLFGKPIMKNGSLIGQDDLSERLGYYSPPRQGWLVVTPGQEINTFGFIEFDHSKF